MDVSFIWSGGVAYSVTGSAGAPSIFLVERDDECRRLMAEDMRSDGMTVSTFASSSEALTAVTLGERPAVLVITPEGDGLADGELAWAVKAASPQAGIVFTGRHSGALCPPRTYMLAKPFAPGKLSRFIRLVVARPALRSTLQALYRRAHSADAKAAK